MALRVLGHTRDLRSDTPVIYCQMDIPQYLRIVGEDFGNFTIQRRRESHKAYRRLSLDIKNGALLPSITLAVKPEFVSDIIPLLGDVDKTALALDHAGRVDILDGLQRTYIMHDLMLSRHQFSEDQKILVEFWLESDIKKLIYRIIVLNAGQKPMSIRHQVELLFMSLKTSIENQIEHLQIYTERDTTRRRRSRKFPLNVVVSAYQAHITASTESQKDNIIANKMQIEEALDASEEDISDQFQSFIKYLKIYAELDDQVFRIYQGDGDQEPELDPIDQIDGAVSVKPSRNVHWLASENVFVSFFAAIAQFTSSELPENIALKADRLDKALNKLIMKLNDADRGTDPLDLEVFDRLRMGNNPRKVNVGAATRKLLVNGFKEFFRDEGDSSLGRAWQLASE